MTLERANNNLKECPFCGSKVEIENYQDERTLLIDCPVCGANMAQEYLADKTALDVLLDRWNRRA